MAIQGTPVKKKAHNPVTIGDQRVWMRQWQNSSEEASSAGLTRCRSTAGAAWIQLINKPWH